MPSMSATSRSAGSGSQPPCCSWARHSSGMTAEACLPGGYLAIVASAQAAFSGVNAKLAGWSGLSLRTAMLGLPSCSECDRRPPYRGRSGDCRHSLEAEPRPRNVAKSPRRRVAPHLSAHGGPGRAGAAPASIARTMLATAADMERNLRQAAGSTWQRSRRRRSTPRPPRKPQSQRPPLAQSAKATAEQPQPDVAEAKDVVQLEAGWPPRHAERARRVPGSMK